MKKTAACGLFIAALAAAACLPIPAPGPAPGPDAGAPVGPGGRGSVARLSGELAGRADVLSRSSFEHFKGWNGRITDEEQVLLFKSEEFSASARFFARLAEETSDFYRPEILRASLFSAFLYLAASFRQLDADLGAGRI
ncbi:MAG: hypothetical protein ABSA30_14905, partial [Candidatus Aminicenantales bacterium]